MMRWNALPAPGIWAPPPRLRHLLDELRELRWGTEYVFVMPTDLSLGLRLCSYDLLVRHAPARADDPRASRRSSDTSGMRSRFPTTVLGRRFETAEEYLQAEIDQLLGVGRPERKSRRSVDSNAS